MATAYPISSVSGLVVLSNHAPLTYGTPQPAQSVRLTVESGAMPDLLTGMLGKGIGRIYGTVELKGSPQNTLLRRKVWLVREVDGLKIREQWSDAVTGAYDFRYIDELQTWAVTAFDHTGEKRAVVARGLVPDLIV